MSIALAIPGYSVLELIYESAKTAVYRAVRDKDGMPTAIKTLRGEYPSRQELARFRHEYHIWEKLAGTQGVAGVYALENYGNKPALVLEYIAGGNLLALQIGRKENRLEWFFTLATQIAQALGEIHRRDVIHKDINPHNILWEPNSGAIKIVDFDIASELSCEKQSQGAPLLKGSLPYISPEQTGRMNRAIDYRSDFYSMGVTFYQLLSSELPFDIDDNDPVSWIHCHIAKEPKPLRCCDPAIAQALGAIIGKLLAKNAEDRYQSALGVKNDLEYCRLCWKESGAVLGFIPGQQDFSDRFEIPQKLYGRKDEADSLMQAIAEIGEGASKMFLVSGYSGIGKSALIHEVHKPIAAGSGYFIEGKFDQFQQNIPYFAIVQAFGRLIRQLLSEAPESLQRWRSELLAALGPNGQVLTDMIPELESIIGPQPRLPHLGTEENQNRFNRLFQEFLRVFAGKQQPLVLFIDDLQWVDSASLNLIRQSLLNKQLKRFLFIGAYRDNEVDEHHPFIAAVRELKKGGVEVTDLILKPLTLEHIKQLIVETLAVDASEALSLAALVLRKTAGNPFFISQFLKNSYETGLFTFDAAKRCWRWDLNEIARQHSSDNVIDLMVAKIARLPESTRDLLRLGACIGNVFNVQTLAIIAETSPVQTAKQLWPAVDAGLLLADGEGHALLKCMEETGGEIFPAVSNRFLHDRVQQAAYSLIDIDQKQHVHLKIARLLLRETPQEELENYYFDIVEHYNKSSALVDDHWERRMLAELNLKAGQKAWDATAYGPALQYFQHAAGCCRNFDAQQHYRLIFDIEKGQLECHFLLGEVAEGVAKADALLKKCQSAEDKVAVNNILILYYGGAGEMDKAIDIALHSLRYFGVNLPRNPGKPRLLLELLEAKLRLGGKSAQQLTAMPLFRDKNIHIVFSLLKELIAPTYLQGLTNLLPFIILRMFNLTLKHGNSPVASFVYSGYALLWAKLDNFAEAYRFGVLALEYNKKISNPPMEARCYFMTTSFALYWRQPFRDAQALRKTGLQKLVDTGEYFWASYIYLFGFWQEVLLCNSLEEIIELTEREIQFAKKAGQIEPYHVHTLHRNLFRTLGEETFGAASTDLGGDEKDALAYFECNITSTMGKFYHVVCRLLLHFYREEYEQGLYFATRPDMTEEVVRDGTFTRVIYTFFSCLTILARENSFSQHRGLYRQRRRKLHDWYQLFPENFAVMWLLLQAQEAARDGLDKQAMDSYEQAIEAAQENNSSFLASLASELYGKFWLQRGKQKIANVYMTEAAYLYYRWGAIGKQQHLQTSYKAVFSEQVAAKAFLKETGDSKKTTTIELDNGESLLDFNTLAKASQALSGEIVLDKLLRKLMHFLIESAGAQKGVLLLQENGRLVVSASCTSEHGQEAVVLQKMPLEDSAILSIAIVRFVARSKEMVVLGNASGDAGFAQDPYLRRQNVKSVLCFPLLQDGERLKGILYLENNIAADSFTPRRVEVLQVLSGEILIALDNARLYRNLEEYSQTLEEKVLERTKDLQAVNAALLSKNIEIRESKDIIEEKNASITKSILYAQRIQQALLPQHEKIAEAFPNFFVVFKPKQIVSGDFYWFNRLDDKIFLVVADCTGHGVPGGFLSMIGHMLLNKIINAERIFDPARILEYLHEEVRNVLRQEGKTRQANDGMDIGLCRVELDRRKLIFAGAKRPLYFVKNQHAEKTVFRIHGDRKSIGGRQKESHRLFTNHIVDFNSGDAFYLLSDGFTDQHDANNEKLGSAKLESLLQIAPDGDMTMQKIWFENELQKYQESVMQRDDITLVGVKL